MNDMIEFEAGVEILNGGIYVLIPRGQRVKLYGRYRVTLEPVEPEPVSDKRLVAALHELADILYERLYGPWTR
jgi:hypothetical protein